MEVTLFLLSIVPCFALVVGQIPVAPMDISTTCRTNFMFRAAHDWIPYVNDTSDGVRGQVKWQVLLDQYDYENLLGSGLFPPSPWEARQFDTDNAQFTLGSGGNCQYQLRIPDSSLRIANPDNWVFTQSVNLLDAVEIYVNATIRLTGCHQRASANPPCQKNYVTLNTYNTNSPQTVEQRTDPNNYQPYLGDSVRSRLVQNAGDSGRIIMTYPRPQNIDFTHFGIQDTGTIGVFERLLVYYRVAQGYEDGLVVCPSVALPAIGSGATNTKSCTCKANSTPTTSLVRTCDENGICQESPACECNPGYEYNSTLGMCIGCGMGTYKTSLSSTARCIPCPGKSMTINSSSTVCDCIRGTVRCPSRPDDACQLFEDFFAGGEVDCETESSQSSSGLNQAGAIAVTFFVTLIITAVLTALVVFLLLYFLVVKR